MQHTTGVRTLVVADEDSVMTQRLGARVVRTPLDLIQALDDRPERVVLVGKFAREQDFASFIQEASPTSEVVAVMERIEPVQLACA